MEADLFADARDGHNERDGGPRASMPSLSVSSWVNDRTAAFCEDYPAKRAVNLPASRPIMRCALAAATAVLALVLISALFLTRSDSYRTVRSWNTRFLFAPDAWALDYGNIICPCNNTFAPWTLFVHLYWVDKDLNRQTISNQSQFCDALDTTGTSPQQLWKQGCHDMAFAAFDINGSRSIAASTTLQGAESLSYLISASFRRYLDHEFSKYEVLATNYSRDWLQLRWVNDILQNAASRPFVLAARRFLGNHTLLDKLFYMHMKYMWLLDPRKNYMKDNGSAGEVKALHWTGGRAVSMELNWTSYVLWCDPLYCDSVEKNSKFRRFVMSMGEIGGFFAILLLLIRSFVWPLVRYTFGFGDSLQYTTSRN